MRPRRYEDKLELSGRKVVELSVKLTAARRECERLRDVIVDLRELLWCRRTGAELLESRQAWNDETERLLTGAGRCPTT